VSEVVTVDVELEAGLVTDAEDLDVHGIGVIDEAAGDEGDEIAQSQVRGVRVAAARGWRS